MQNEDYFKDKPHIKLDRYFLDKKDNKKMCKLCGPHYIERQFIDSLPVDEEPDTEKFLIFIMENFERVFLKR